LLEVLGLFLQSVRAAHKPQQLELGKVCLQEDTRSAKILKPVWFTFTCLQLAPPLHCQTALHWFTFTFRHLCRIELEKWRDEAFFNIV
jgi:hypothetical protein